VDGIFFWNFLYLLKNNLVVPNILLPDIVFYGKLHVETIIEVKFKELDFSLE